MRLRYDAHFWLIVVISHIIPLILKSQLVTFGYLYLPVLQFW